MLETPRSLDGPSDAPSEHAAGGLRARLVDRLGGRVELVALAAAAMLAFRDAFRVGSYNATVQGADAPQFFEPASSSPLLILAGAVWMISHRRYEIAAACKREAGPSRAAPLLATPLLALSVGLALWSHWVGAPNLSVPALSLGLLGAGAAVGGAPLVRVLTVPALFLLLAAPPPGYWLNQILFPLQLASASLATAYLNGMGIPATHSLDLIFVGGRVFHVIESCAGFRMIETLVMASFIYTEVFPSRPLQRAILIVSAPIVAFLLNGFRIISIVLAPFETSHVLQGIAVLVLGVLVLAAMDRLLSRWIGRPPEHPPRAAVRLPRRQSLLVASVFALVGVITLVLPPYEPSRDDIMAMRFVPSRYGEWQGSGARIERDFMGSVRPDLFVRYTLHRGDEEMGLFVAVDDLLDPHGSIVSEKTLYMEMGARVVSTGASIAGDRRRIRSALYQSPADGGWRLSHRWYGGMGSRFDEALRSLLGLDRSPLRREKGMYVVHLSRRLGQGAPSAADLARAEADLDEVGVQVERTMRRLRDDPIETSRMRPAPDPADARPPRSPQLASGPRSTAIW